VEVILLGLPLDYEEENLIKMGDKFKGKFS
jgi:hypothetical protein